MITFEKSSTGLGKTLKWLPEMAFQGFWISKISGGACPQTPLGTRASGASLPCLPTQISSYGHEFNAINSCRLDYEFITVLTLKNDPPQMSPGRPPGRGECPIGQWYLPNSHQILRKQRNKPLFGWGRRGCMADLSGPEETTSWLDVWTWHFQEPPDRRQGKHEPQKISGRWMKFLAPQENIRLPFNRSPEERFYKQTGIFCGISGKATSRAWGLIQRAPIYNKKHVWPLLELRSVLPLQTHRPGWKSQGLETCSACISVSLLSG